jgi:hypothetical protein
MKCARLVQQFVPRGAPWCRRGAVALLSWAMFASSGGCETPSPHTISRNYSLRPDLPVDPPGSEDSADQDCIEGGRLYKYYCGSCHNARPLGERPFSNYHVAVAHMRDQAYLTGKEYRQITMFLRRWQDLGPPTKPVEPSPKRMIFSQPIAELRKDSSVGDKAPPPNGAGPWQDQAPAGAQAAPAPKPGGPAPPPPGANDAGLPALPAPIN